MEGFRAASAFVEVSAKLSDREVLDAARRAAGQVDSTLTSGMKATGRSMSEELGRAGDEGGRNLVERSTRRLRDERGRFIAAGKAVGEDVSSGIKDSVDRKTDDTFSPLIRKSKKVGTDTGSSFLSGFGPKLAQGMSGSMIGAATPAIVALSPLIAATIAGAVVGGVGVGGVVGGAILAARDERVKAAGTQLGQFIMGDLEKRSANFVPPVLAGITRIKGAWIDMGPDIDRIFNSSRFVEPLLDGALKGGKKLVHGIADAVDEATPVVDAFGRMFDGIGESASNFFTTVAGDAKEGASAIDDMTVAITNAMDTVTRITHYGAEIKGATDKLDVWIDRWRYWYEDTVNNSDRFKELGLQLDLTADGFEYGSKQALALREASLGTATTADFVTLKMAGMTDAQIAAADASGTYRQKLDEVNREAGTVSFNMMEASGALKIMNSSMTDGIKFAGSLSNAFKLLNGNALDARAAESAYQGAIDAISASAKAMDKAKNSATLHKNALNLDTEAGRKNDQLVRNLVTTIDQKAQAAYNAAAATGNTAKAEKDAAKVYEQGRAQLIKNLTQLLGNKEAAIQFADSIYQIPKNWNTDVKATDKATPTINSIKHEISTIHGKTVTIAVKYETHGSAQGEHIIGQGTQLKASGGWILGGSGVRDDVPVLAMDREFMIRQGAAIAIERQFPGFLDSLNNFDRGGAPQRAVMHGIQPETRPAHMPAPAMTAPVQTATRPMIVNHFAPGSFTLDLSRIKTVDDFIRALENITPAVRAWTGKGGKWTG